MRYFADIHLDGFGNRRKTYITHNSMITESKLQADCYIWFHNTFPKLRGLLCYNLNNSKNKIDGNRNKAMGLQKGRADMTFYFDGRAYFFEFKVDTGKQSPEQVEWERKVTEHGFSYWVIRSFYEFQERLHEVIFPMSGNR